MAAFDNKVLIEGINLMASAARYTNRPWARGGLREEQSETADSSHTSTHISIIHLRKWTLWIDLLADLDRIFKGATVRLDYAL